MIRLDCLEGPLEGTTFVFESNTVTIGRSPVCELVVDDPMCSRRHVEIKSQRGTCVASDSIDVQILGITIDLGSDVTDCIN